MYFYVKDGCYMLELCITSIIIVVILFIYLIIFFRKNQLSLKSERDKLNQERRLYRKEKASFDKYCESRKRAIDKESENIYLEWQKIAEVRASIKNNATNVDHLSYELAELKRINDILSNDLYNLKEHLSNSQISISEKDIEIKNKESEISRLKKALEDSEAIRQAEKDAFDNDKCHQFHLMLDESQIYKYTINSQMYAFLHNEPIVQPRLLNYINDLKNNPQYHISVINITAQITGSGNNVYYTSLDKCTCKDYINDKGRPCKHMFRLAHELAMFNDLPVEKIEIAIRKLAEEANYYRDAIKKFDKKYKDNAK